MARPPLPIGTYGNVSVRPTSSGGYVARVRFRDADGVTRGVTRAGRTAAIARNKLLTALGDRTSPNSSSGLSADSKFREAADIWLASVDEGADTGELSENTAQLYGLQLRNHVLPALGALRLREVTTPRVDDFLRATRIAKGVATAKTCRTVVSGVMGLVVRYGALPVNPFVKRRECAATVGALPGR